MVTSALILLAAIYTNMTQLLNVPLSREVVTEFPASEYDTPQKTILSFNRAAVLGDFTNMYHCCTAECNKEDLEVDTLAEVPDDIIRQSSVNAQHDFVEKCVSIDVREDSTNRYKAVLRYQSLRPDNTNSFERVVFELQRQGEGWKISRWDQLLTEFSE